MSDNTEIDTCLADGSTQEQELKALEVAKPTTKPVKAATKPVKAPEPVAASKPAPAAAVKEEPVQSLFKRVDLNGFYPPFLAKLEAVLADCEAQGARYYVICGLRTADEQNKLFQQGRGADKGKRSVVTNAKAYESMHQFYVAADMCRDADMQREGLQPDWNAADYQILADTAKKHGLESAFFWKSFKEGPHVQLPLDSRGVTKEALRDAFLKGGKLALFSLLDKYRW